MTVWVVDTHLHLPPAVPLAVAREIESELTFGNPEAAAAAKMQTWGWQRIPKTICLADGTKVPRGYARDLCRLYKRHGLEIKFQDDRVTSPSATLMREVQMRPYQVPVVESMLKAQQGIVDMATGGGKTIIALEAIRRSGQKAIVIVNRMNLIEQWAKPAKEMFGIEIAQVGDGIFQDGDLVIALQQTIHQRTKGLDHWFDSFGFVVLDEAHAVSARTYVETMERFPAKYRFGLTATPDRRRGWFPLVTATIGPVISTIAPQELEQTGVLHKPSVVKVDTDFGFTFWGNHNVNCFQTCQVPRCKKNGADHGHRTNYPALTKELAGDIGRAKLVASIASKEAEKGHAVLVLSKRLRHLDLIRDYIEGDFSVMMMTGQHDAESRASTRARIDEGACVVLSTVADEALDAPRLDRVILAWPTRNEAMVTQQVGRILRAHPEKTDAIVFDLVDSTGVGDNQWRERLGLYRKRGFTMHRYVSAPPVEA